ncbi:MAG: hypothetical protein WKF35_05660 [Ferruginibacter sp.]
MKKLPLIFLFFSTTMYGQDVNVLVNTVKEKLDKINDYQAEGRMKTNVAFLKVPVANISVYFKKPNKLKVKSEKGISFIPKGAVSINMNNVFADNEYTIIDAGTEKIGKVTVRVAKLLPVNDNSEVVLSTIHIDPLTNLIYRSKTTTRENGTYQLELSYGKYISYGLPDKIIFSFNTRDYKLPKGMTFDFDDGTKPAAKNAGKNKQGKAEITFNSYIINKGIPDSKFK